MFGVVPKSIWNRSNPADENNLIDMAARCLLVEDGNRLILIDNGLGNKQSEKFFSYYYLWGDHSLESSLKGHGFHPDDVTDVFLTHLHFDHCGGGIRWNRNHDGYEPVFKNAAYWTNKDHWEWAINPNAREKASFLKENLLPMQESGQLQFINPVNTGYLGESPLGFGILFANGHTDKQMLPHIRYKGTTLVFVADLLPTTGHIPLPYIMGYDTRPLLTLEEKAAFLNKAATEGYFLFLEHDAYTQVCTLKHTDKGVRLDKTFSFDELYN